jgi:hypothetical protein
VCKGTKKATDYTDLKEKVVTLQAIFKYLANNYEFLE